MIKTLVGASLGIFDIPAIPSDTVPPDRLVNLHANTRYNRFNWKVTLSYGEYVLW